MSKLAKEELEELRQWAGNRTAPNGRRIHGMLDHISALEKALQAEREACGGEGACISRARIAELEAKNKFLVEEIAKAGPLAKDLLIANARADKYRRLYKKWRRRAQRYQLDFCEGFLLGNKIAETVKMREASKVAPPSSDPPRSNSIFPPGRGTAVHLRRDGRRRLYLRLLYLQGGCAQGRGGAERG